MQGHSKKVDIEFKEFIPTKELYHGTADRFYSSILQEGIKKMSRQHVHLSSDIETAKLVGNRHGNVMIIIIDAIKMFKDGYKFYIADNGVILTDIVPTKYFI